MLTDTAIRALKADSRPIKKSDSGGLFIYVTPEGSKLWLEIEGAGGASKASVAFRN